ncbi:MAG: trypsin-like peptidase domain-containing protein [Gammaproteobacteria bacterium]|nr:trypsin-like peptidase domain-containing protein [Gammaproteobacteria bacterium]MBU1655266.1 trypsin-like peptidase domain-containing protein [Gammaproteobacteria bacterium]MBU1962045.1 trypsin-like peptidase domain-containing protein [Gammaproteobacteria bacterium]
MNIRSLISFFLKSVIVGLALAFLIVLARPELLQTGQPEHRPQPQPAQPVHHTAPVLSYADAVNRALPSVANLFVAKVRIQQEARPLFPNPLLQRLFGNRYLVEPHKRVETSLGSGVVVPGGYILTNNHVIQGASLIQAVLPSGRTLEAQVIGADPETDLAVLKTDQKDLPVISIGAMDGLRIGDVVLAIGNPLGVGQTVTQGIISATGRNKLGINSYENFIQTDAAINPGNSGGALVNAQGELIGINTFILSKSGGSQGLGFAIPADMALGVVDQIVRFGRVVRGWIGVSAQNMTPELAEILKTKEIKGVVITGIIKDSPADAAGLQPGDILTHLNGLEMRDSVVMMQGIAEIQPGAKAIVQGWRGEQRIELPILIQERQQQGETAPQ